MQELGDWGSETSPFHEGEQAIQNRLGRRERMEALGRRVIRPYLPEQHRSFLEQLPYVVAGSVDTMGSPWASLLVGEPGFLSSPDPRTIVAKSAPLPGDPLEKNLREGAPLGLLGIELESRRRNRANVRVAGSRPGELVLSVDQSFGNCPQYIRSRPVRFVREADTSAGDEQPETLDSLSEEATRTIRAADTFFVSSFVEADEQAEIEGVDVSHRGGRPGFVKVEGDTLTVPDFSGNSHFNTLGNFLLNPKAGLSFVDFETGDVLMLSGSVEILWEDSPEVQAFRGAERAWRFRFERGVWLRNALPLRWSSGEDSPNNSLTGDWENASANLAAEARRDAWRPYRVVQIEDESADIRSFHLEPKDGLGLSPHRAGQFLTIRTPPDAGDEGLIRTYTLSSAPEDPHYRISVKRESARGPNVPAGRVSSYLHERVAVGDSIEARAPRGDFVIDAEAKRPAVLIAGGVGITPMISMARHLVLEAARTRQLRPVTVFHAARTTAQRSFREHFKRLEESTGGVLRYLSFISQPEPGEAAGRDFDTPGRISADDLRSNLPLDDYDFFLCGPAGFMQAMYDLLRQLGVSDERISSEAFGPASLERSPSTQGATPDEGPGESKGAVVRFADSAFEQAWSPEDGTLLELAEAHGLSPEFGCRGGACGSCAVRITQGDVAYRSSPRAPIGDGEALLCCAVPARGSEIVELAL